MNRLACSNGQKWHSFFASLIVIVLLAFGLRHYFAEESGTSPAYSNILLAHTQGRNKGGKSPSAPKPNVPKQQVDTLVIPELTIENEDLVDVLTKILPREFQKVDPKGIGINIVPMFNLPGNLQAPIYGHLITLKLSNITPRKVLNVIASRFSLRILIVSPNCVAVAHPQIAAYANVPRFDDSADARWSCGISARSYEIVIREFDINNETLDDVLTKILPNESRNFDPGGIGIKIVSNLTPPRHAQPTKKFSLGKEMVNLHLHNVTPRDILSILALQFFLKFHVTDSEIIVTELL